MSENIETPQEQKPEKRQTDRRFRRYHKAQQRRRQAELEDAKFTRSLFSIAAIGAALAIGLGVIGINGGNIGNAEEMGALTDPWLGSMSKIEAFGIGFVALVGALYFWRLRKR